MPDLSNRPAQHRGFRVNPIRFEQPVFHFCHGHFPIFVDQIPSLLTHPQFLDTGTQLCASVISFFNKMKTTVNLTKEAQVEVAAVTALNNEPFVVAPHDNERLLVQHTAFANIQIHIAF